MNKFFGSEQEDDVEHVVSHSQMKMWRECRHKWALHYRDKLRPPEESIYFIFGSSIHEVLQLYLRKMYGGTAKEADELDLKGRFNTLLKEEYDDRKEAFNEDYPDREFPVTKKEMVQFYRDGEQIIDYFKRNRSEYFPKRTMELVGIEEKVEKGIKPGVAFVGYLDIVLRDKVSGTYKIIDLKASTDGWDKWKKREKKRTDQLVAYKSFYADKLGVAPSEIEIEYLIMKRELNSNAPYKPSRFQRFSPSAGSQSQSRVEKKIQEFVDNCFTEDGDYREGDFEKNQGKFTCVFCPYSKQFGEEGYRVCDQSGERYLDFPESMRPYIDDKYIGPQPEQKSKST